MPTGQRRQAVKFSSPTYMDSPKSYTSDPSSSASDLSLDPEPENPQKPFPFFDLPAEIRHEILDLVFKFEKSIDIDVKAVDLLSKFFVSKQFYFEAVDSFYSGNTFRILPTCSRAVARRAQPLLRHFPRVCRSRLLSLELRLGPFWTKPPKCWKINKQLGLEDAVHVRVLNVFMEIDPAHPVFNGFRNEKVPYAEFAGSLLEAILERMPNVVEVHLDGYPSVFGNLPMAKKMADIAIAAGRKISWGPGRLAGEIEYLRGSNPTRQYYR